MARDTFEDVDKTDAEAGPDHLANGVVIATTVVLIAACVMMQKALDKHFGAGMFAEKKAAGAP
jgi:hypothetical protein